MKLQIRIVDAFTTQKFAGNPAAVIVLNDWLPDALMQNIASENNLSETAFVLTRELGVYDIRWFSPLREVAFCGHATLASAFVLFSTHVDLSKIEFEAKAVGKIIVHKRDNGQIEMAFPNRAPLALADVPQALREGLSITPVAYLKNKNAYFAVMQNEDQVRAVVPNLEKLKTLDPLDVVVTARGDTYDFASRYFWPANGGAEDPVTGSIHAGLAPYWAKELNKTQLVAYQASARSGVLYCRVQEDTVFVAGFCAAYLDGTIEV